MTTPLNSSDWPEIYPVNDAGGVEVFDTAQHLIKKIRQPLVVQLHLNDLAQVGIHQLHYQVAGKESMEEGGRGIKLLDLLNCTNAL